MIRFTSLYLAAITCLITPPCGAFAQPQESFFPSQVGNLWQYFRPAGSTSLEDWSILRDSLDGYGYRYLYVRIQRTGEEYWQYRLDSASNVSQSGGDPWPDTLYRLAADSGEAWIWYNNGYSDYYGWVTAIQPATVFGRATTVKIIRWGPIHPDSGGNSFFYTEQHLASGFGVIYHWEEPGYVAFLSGCVIAGDTFGIVTSVPLVDSPEGNFVLEQNYPNPFNASTAIEFSLPSESPVKLSVFDILGRQIAMLIDEKRSMGRHRIVFDGANLSSGVYFVKLVVNESVSIRKITLTK